MKIILFTKFDRLGASSRIRALQYTDKLSERGIHVYNSPLITNDMLEKRYKSGSSYSLPDIMKRYVHRAKLSMHVRNYDIVWIQKELLPGLPFWIEHLLLIQAKVVILDIDDAEYIKYDQSNSIITRLLLAGKFERLSHFCDTVIVGNRFLENIFKKWNPKVNIQRIPSVINFEHYQKAVDTGLKSNDRFVIGWIGSPTTEKYVKNIITAIDRLASSKGPAVELWLIGASPVSFAEFPFVRHFPWAEDRETELMSNFDVGIMPLDSTEVSKGKCAFKIVQYMAMKLPVVVTPIEANTDIVCENINGIYARTLDDWYEALQLMRNDSSLREKMGAANIEKISKDYSVESQIETLCNIFKGRAIEPTADH